MERRARWPGLLSGAAAVLAATVGCAPVVDVRGVFFPGWLVSAVIGVVASYSMVFWLGSRPRTRALAESSLFFLSLLVGIALSAWWVLFSDF